MSFESRFRSFAGRINSMSRDDMVIITRELLKQLNDEKKVKIKGWKGKSSFDYKFISDKIIVIKYQKPEKGAEPKEVKYEITTNDYYTLKSIILHTFEKEKVEYIKSRDLAEWFYNKFWREIFNDRKTHNKFTIILNVLDKEGVIKYKGGKVYPKN